AGCRGDRPGDGPDSRPGCGRPARPPISRYGTRAGWPHGGCRGDVCHGQVDRMKLMRIRHWAAAVLLVVIVTAVAGVLASRATARAEVREIALVARGMAFYAGGSDANPTITLRPGERVRFIVRNETPGMLHDIAIDAL